MVSVWSKLICQRLSKCRIWKAATM